MKTTRCAVLLVALLSAAPSAAATATAVVPFEEIDRGEISGFLYNFPDFTGAELHITDRRSWAEFWKLHTRTITPAPPLPAVRFTDQNVIVLLLGYQTTGAGPSIGVHRITRTDRMSTVEVFEDPRPGILTVITNPYQIIVTPSLGRSVAFVHSEPGARLCQSVADCPVDHVCSLQDPTCSSPVMGQCLFQPPGSVCPTVEMPVCGCDGMTYSNACFLELAGAIFKQDGACP